MDGETGLGYLIQLSPRDHTQGTLSGAFIADEDEATWGEDPIDTDLLNGYAQGCFLRVLDIHLTPEGIIP
jgi:hypothetical protein